MTRGPWLLAAILAAVGVLLVHGGTLRGGLVYDDHRFIEHNPAIRQVLLVRAFRDPATASHTEGIVPDIYRPLRTVLFSCEYALFAHEGADGTIDFGLPWWHLVSLLLHLANTLLVLRLLKPLFRGALLPAFLGALLFGIHPLTSECVAWLSSQGDLLAMTFLLSALVLLERRGLGRTLGGTACFALACLAKESALMMPFLLPLRDLALPRGEDAPPSPWARATCGRAGLLLLVTGGYFALRTSVLPGLAQVGYAYGSLWATVRAMLHGVVWYAGAVLAPLGFSFDTRLDVPVRWTDPDVVLGLGLLATTVAAGIFGLVRRRPLLALASLGVLVALGPVSNVIVPLKTFVADRFFYPALPFVAVGLGALLLRLGPTWRATVVTVTLAALGVGGWLSARRDAAWASEMSLWKAVRADRPWNANAWQGLAFEYAKQHRVADAESAYGTYLEANPLDGKAIYVMGNLMGEVADSIVPAGPGAAGTNEGPDSVRARHRQARVAQIRLYQRAFGIWNRPGGLVVGRGSEAMAHDMLERWVAAGLDLGDLGTARFANDRLIMLESRAAGHPIDPRDTAAVMSGASWARRRARAALALRALRGRSAAHAPADVRAHVEAERAEVLRDVGMDPRRSSESLRGPMIALLTRLEEEAVRDDSLTPDARLFLELAGLLQAEGHTSEAVRTVRRGLAVHPGDPLLQRALAALGP